MLFFGSKSPKRTSLWSNSPEIAKFWLGKLTKKIREEHKKRHPDFRTTIQYVDKDGRKRFHGSKQLRSTQNLGLFVACMLAFYALSLTLQFSYCIIDPRVATAFQELHSEVCAQNGAGGARYDPRPGTIACPSQN